MIATLGTAVSAEDNSWKELVDKCKHVVLGVRADDACALLGYHDLGKIILAAGIHGEQIKKLSKELRKASAGFSATNLYTARKFAERYPDFNSFVTKYGVVPWRNVGKLLVDHPRTESNALDSAMNSTTPVTKLVKIDPTTIKWYNYERKRGYEGDLNSFLNKCVTEHYEPSGPRYRIEYGDGRIEYWEPISL
jgi:hypothetical protein